MYLAAKLIGEWRARWEKGEGVSGKNYTKFWPIISRYIYQNVFEGTKIR